MKNTYKILIIPLFLFMLLFGTSKMTAHAEETDNVYAYTYELKFSPNHNFSQDYDYSSIQVVSDMPIVFYIEDEHNIIYALCTDNGNASMSSYYHIQDGLDGPSKFGVTGDMHTVNKYEVLDNFIQRMFYLPELLMDCSNNVMLFNSYDSARAYIDFGNENGWINNPNVDLDKDGIFNSSMEIPKLAVDTQGYGFGFNNGSENVYFEMKGRWYSVDDITLYKENLMWKHKYDTLLKSDLTTWVSLTDRKLSTERFDFAELGQSSFSNFLQQYPIDSRTYLGGTNSLGNWLGGYNDALELLKMDLSTPTGKYNGVEVYVRYYYFTADNKLIYSKWTHYYDNLASTGTSGTLWDDKENAYTENQSQNGLTNDEMENLEGTNNSIYDNDAVPNYNNYTNYVDSSENLIKGIQNLIGTLKGLFNQMGEFPSLVNNVFGYLPSWLINLIAVSLGCLILLRIVGR